MVVQKLELVSFKLCPFVQRAVITLKQKNIDFDITFIDLDNPPDWFVAISPLGQVPILKVGDDVVFESTVIQEYIDEITLPQLHPQGALQKAHNRSWMAYGSEIMPLLRQLAMAKDKSNFDETREALNAKLAKIEQAHSGENFFNGNEFCLIDASYAPIFMRLNLLTELTGETFFEQLPKMAHWSIQLNAMSCVKDSVVPEFSMMYKGMLKHMQGYLATQLTQ